MNSSSDLIPEENCSPRSASRLAALQALYQIEFSGNDPESVINEFIDYRQSTEVDGGRYVEPDFIFFQALVRGGAVRSKELDILLDEFLGPERTSARLDGILRVLLRTATFELLDRHEVPPRVILDEYLDLAHAFFSGPEPRLVNGVLDALARRLRPGDL